MDIPPKLLLALGVCDENNRVGLVTSFLGKATSYHSSPTCTSKFPSHTARHTILYQRVAFFHPVSVLSVPELSLGCLLGLHGLRELSLGCLLGAYFD